MQCILISVSKQKSILNEILELRQQKTDTNQRGMVKDEKRAHVISKKEEEIETINKTKQELIYTITIFKRKNEDL